MENKETITIKGSNNKTLKINYVTYKKTRVKLNLFKHNGKSKEYVIDGGLFGVLISCLERVLNKWDSVIIITGNVGDGKSTLAQLITAIWEWFFDRKQEISQIVFRTENFMELIEREDNKTQCLLWDESISGISGRDSITKQGQALKKAFITKRYKQHMYLLLVDEIQEYNKKILSRTRCWIHCYTIGMKRGFFKIYDDQIQIKRIYRKIKQYNLELEEVIKTERESYRGFMPDTTGEFFNEKEYQNKKASETNIEDENSNSKDNRVIEQRNKLITELNKLGMKQKDISALIQLNKVSVSTIIKEQNEKIVS